eukprot:COSAG01_NODE_2110_length_8408_cov_19.542183_1_plen_903_part_10
MARGWQSALSAAAVLLLYVGASSSFALALNPVPVDMDMVRARLIASMVAPPGSSSQKAAVKAAEVLARELLSNGTFPDIDYHERRRAAWPMIAHLTRVQSMAAAWRGAGTNASSRAQLSPLLAKALSALNVWLVNDWQNPNWYDNEIGVPRLMGNIGLLLHPALPARNGTKMAEIMSRADWRGGGSVAKPRWTGANLLDMLRIQIHRGLFCNDSALVAQGFARSFAAVAPHHQNGESVMVDHSFHQHGPQLLSGAYGAVFTADILALACLSASTAFAMPITAISVFEGLVLEGQARMSRAGSWDWQVHGRGISEGATAMEISFDVQHMRDFARQVSPARNTDWLAFAHRIEHDDASPRAALTGTRGFWDSDFLSHSQPGYYFSVHMFSARTIPGRWHGIQHALHDGCRCFGGVSCAAAAAAAAAAAVAAAAAAAAADDAAADTVAVCAAACVNEQGKLDRHLSDGATALLKTGHEYDGIWPVWNWTRPPGTTVATAAVAPSCGNARHATGAKFVGSAADGRRGVAVQHLSGKIADTLPAAEARPTAFNCTRAGGVEAASVCCMKSCGVCGKRGCSRRKGGAKGCCGSQIQRSCSPTVGPPCLINGTSPPHPDATANKTWLIFESMIVAVGDAEVPPVGQLVTSVEQALLQGAVYVGDTQKGQLLPAGSERALNLSEAGAWVLHNGIGYLLPQTKGASAHVSIKNKSGDWSSIGVESGSITLGVFDLFIVHAQEYAYMIIPVNATVSDMPAALATTNSGYALAGDRNTEFRAALNPIGDTLLAAVWADAGTAVNVGCWSIRTSRACALLLQKYQNGSLSASVSAPGTDGGIVTLVIEDSSCGRDADSRKKSGRGWRNVGCAATPNGGLLVSFSLPSGDFSGKTETVLCEPTNYAMGFVRETVIG